MKKLLFSSLFLIFLSFIFLTAPRSYAQFNNNYTPLAPIQTETTTFVGQTVDTNNLNGYLNNMFKLGIAVAGALAVVMIILGGVQYMSSDAIGKKEDGKKKIGAAMTGLIVALGSFMLLNTLSPDFLSTKLTLNDPLGIRRLSSGNGDGNPAHNQDQIVWVKTYDDPDGTQHVTYKNGDTKTLFNDGTVQTKDKNGTVTKTEPPPSAPPETPSTIPPTTPPGGAPKPDPCTKTGSTPEKRGNSYGLVIGDSIAESMNKNDTINLNRSNGLFESVDAKKNRRLDQALDIVNNKDYEETLKLNDNVILELGTNQSSNFASDAQKMVDRIHTVNPNAHIYWVEVFSKDPAQTQTYAAENKAIRDIASKDGKVTVIPTKDAKIELSPDKTHPTSTGERQLANIISQYLPNCPKS